MDAFDLLTVFATWAQLWFLTWKVAKVEARLKLIEKMFKTSSEEKKIA